MNIKPERIRLQTIECNLTDSLEGRIEKRGEDREVTETKAHKSRIEVHLFFGVDRLLLNGR